MTEALKRNLSEALKIVISILGGAIITLLLTTVSRVNSNTERIARLEVIVEPMRNVPADIARLQSTADRNVSTLDRVEKKLDAHLVAGK